MTRVPRATLAALTALFLTTVVVVAGTRLLQAAPAAPADSTPTVQPRVVNQRVKDFPKKTDLSTPESALAAICRAFGRADIHALDDLVPVYWGKDVTEAIEHALKHDPSSPKRLNEMMSPRSQQRHRLADDEAVTAEKKTGSSHAGPRPWKLPNGTMMVEASTGPPIKDELKNLIAEKKYEFVSTFDSPNGEKQYIYSFVFSDGSRTRMNFPMRLERASSWDDYQQRRDRQRQRRHDRINQAIAAGRFRLLNLEVMQVHLCRDVLSDKKFKVQRIRHRDGSEIAVPRPDYGAVPPSLKKTSWQEHLQAIRDGRRTLLELETVNSYTYEMTADDGTKLVFQYGGDAPLKMPEE